jgi:hypothetical protein
MDLRELYKENFSVNEIISLINAYATMVNNYSDDDIMCKLNCLMDVLEEKSEKTSKTKYGF